MTIPQFKEYITSSTDFSFQDGIWYAANSSKLSYPDEGHEDCFEIEENSFWFRHRNNCLVSVIQKYSPDNLFFDVGGGNGFVAKALENAQIQTVLVEPGRSGVLNAKKRNLENIICGTIRDLRGLTGQVPSTAYADVINKPATPSSTKPKTKTDSGITATDLSLDDINVGLGSLSNIDIPEINMSSDRGIGGIGGDLNDALNAI